MIDKIVEEARQAGDKLFAQHGDDMHAVAEYLRERERHAGRNVVAMPAKAPQAQELAQARAAGQAYIDSFKGNRKALLADLHRREEKSREAGAKFVSLPPKAPLQSNPRKKAG